MRYFTIRITYYFSLNLYDNKNEQNKNDNFVIKARKLDFEEIKIDENSRLINIYSSQHAI
jgi:hypothetical protein